MSARAGEIERNLDRRRMPRWCNRQRRSEGQSTRRPDRLTASTRDARPLRARGVSGGCICEVLLRADKFRRLARWRPRTRLIAALSGGYLQRHEGLVLALFAASADLRRRGIVRETAIFLTRCGTPSVDVSTALLSIAPTTTET
jgi:hypothetical protein